MAPTLSLNNNSLWPQLIKRQGISCFWEQKCLMSSFVTTLINLSVDQVIEASVLSHCNTGMHCNIIYDHAKTSQ